MPEYTARVARGRCRPHIAAIQGRLMKMAHYWGDIDESMVRRLDELRDEVAGLEREMKDSVEYADECERERDHG